MFLARMAAEVDTVTQRPRTPNDPYTLLTEEQIRNIKKVSHISLACIVFIVNIFVKNIVDMILKLS